jgi:hypothetical protein
MLAILLWLYKLGFQAYPPAFRAEFAAEMEGVFREWLVEQSGSGRRALLAAGFLELSQLPVAAFRLRWRARRKKRPGLPLIRPVYRSPFHPVPPADDGRFSVWQMLLETAPLILVSALLFTIVYLQPGWIPAAWQHQWLDFSGWVVLFALPVFGVGLLRGLPRWAYPPGGLVMGHILFTSGQFYFWAATLLAAYGLALAAVYVHLQHEPLDPLLQRVGRSLAFDWTRLSFGFYSVLPYAIISAFDDTVPNNRTACFALALLALTLGAVGYSRSRQQARQFRILLSGVTLALIFPFLEQVYFQGHWLADLVGLSALWGGVVALLLLPMLASVIYRYWLEPRSTQVER